MHVDNFESLFSITNELAQRVCSVQAVIAFDVKINVTCTENEWRYFKASTKSLTKEIIAIYMDHAKGYADLFHSFTYTNPNRINGDAIFNRQQARYFLLEKNPEEYVYVSMQCLDTNNEIELLLRNEDF
jgi:hypothetical protein